MGDLNRVGRYVRHIFTKEDGTRFYGQLLKPPMSQTRVSTFFNARRILKVDKYQKINNGDVFQLLDGEWGLCFDNTEGYFQQDAIYRTFGVIIMDRELEWKRRITAVDPLTRVEKTIGYQNLGKLKCSMEFIAYSDDSLKIPQPRYRILCGKQILPGDFLDNEITVQHVENVMGIVMAQVRGKNLTKEG